MDAFKVLSHSTTFFHRLFQIMTNMGTFWKCYCFFSQHGNETGVNYFLWEYSKTLFVYICSVWLLCDVTQCYAWWVFNPNWSPICVCEIYTKFGRCSKITWSSLCAWHWASLAHSTAFIFEPTLIRLLSEFSLSWWLLNQLCCLPFLILLKSSHHILLRLFAHRPTTLILRPMSFVQLFMLPALELSFLQPQIQDVQSLQYHTLPWKRLSNFFLKQIIIILVINFIQNFPQLFF